MFEIGQKVVPIRKTAKGYEGLENSSVWQRALENDQPYLYFQGKDLEEDDFYMCSFEERSGVHGGDFFNLEDLIPYKEEKEKPLFAGGFYGNEWFNNLLDFLNWCDKEIKECVPKGICGQSIYITSGQAGFDAKYPTFESAYEAYQKYVESTMK